MMQLFNSLQQSENGKLIQSIMKMTVILMYSY